MGPDVTALSCSGSTSLIQKLRIERWLFIKCQMYCFRNVNSLVFSVQLIL